MSDKVYRKAGSFLAHNFEENAVEARRRLLGVASEDPVVVRACRELQEGAYKLAPHVVEEVARLADEELARYLRYRYRYDVFPATKELDAYPPCLQIEPSSICNYRCVFCYQTDERLTAPKNKHMGQMSLDLFKKVVDEATGQVEAITLASRGEPLIAKGIEPMLEYLRGRFLALKVNTNAWFLDERKCHALLSAGVNTLVFSCDAAEEPLYSSLRVNGKLERVMENIRQFQQIRERHYSDSRTITRVSGVRVSEAQDHGQMEAFWGDLVDQVAFVDYLPWENTYDQPPNGLTTPCSDLFRRMFVWWDGRVNPCDVDFLSKLQVGSAQESSLTELWTGPAYTELRRAHLAGERQQKAPCQGCSLI